MGKQPIWYVDARVVRLLVSAFSASGHRACSGYDPIALDDELLSLRECDGRILFDEVANVLSRHECHKLTASCNTWTAWMRHRLREAKYTMAEAAHG